MAKVYLEDSILTNIANSIRAKNGETITYKPQEMPTAIDNIETGGSGGVEICSDFAYGYSRYGNLIDLINAMREKKNSIPNVCFDLTKCFYNVSFTNDDIQLLKNNKDLFDNVVSYNNLLYGVTSISSVAEDMGNPIFTVNSSVINTSYMFYNCSSLNTLDVSNWDTSNIIEMSYMFYGCKALTILDVSNWNTSNFRIMNNMFYNCTGLTTLDVSNWDASNFGNTSYMFYNCTGLTTLDLSNWDAPNIGNVTTMFGKCSNLSSLKLGVNFKPNTSSLGMFDTSNYNNLDFTMDGNTNFSSYPGKSILYLNNIWRSSSTTEKNLFKKFANGIGTCDSSYNRTITIKNTLYNSLSDSDKAILTNKGYTLSYVS